MNLHLATLKHRTTSGDLDTNTWELVDRSDRPPRIFGKVRLGSACPKWIDVPVCTNEHPEIGCWVLVPVDEGTWKLTPSVWCGAEAMGDRAPHAEGLPIGTILLIDAPPSISEKIRNLGGGR